MTRKSVTILLLLAVIPLLTVVPNAGSQSFTTITNLSTATTQATFTQASRYAIRTTTVTSATSESIFDNSFVQQGVGLRFCYIASPISFDGTAGQQVKGHIESSSKDSLTLYLMNDATFRAWASATTRFCDPIETGQVSLLSVSKVTSYTLDWTVPADGAYWLVVETYCKSDCTVTASIVKYFSQTIVSVIHSSQTSLLLVTATRTVTAISTQELAAPGPLSGDNTLLFAALGALVVVALAVAFFVFSRRKQKKG